MGGKKWGAQGSVFGPIHSDEKPPVRPCGQLVETQWGQIASQAIKLQVVNDTLWLLNKGAGSSLGHIQKNTEGVKASHHSMLPLPISCPVSRQKWTIHSFSLSLSISSPSLPASVGNESGGYCSTLQICSTMTKLRPPGGNQGGLQTNPSHKYICVLTIQNSE